MIENSFNIFFFRKLKNTNDKAREISKSFKNISNLAIYCDAQLEGRGRKGRSWLSYKGDLTCSFLIKKSIKVGEVGRINLFVVSQLIEVFKKIGINEVKFKWPNDLYVNNKKLAGILIETFIEGNIIKKFIIGIGINILNKSSEKEFNSTSFSQLKININPLKVFFKIIKFLTFFTDDSSKIDFRFHSNNLSKFFFSKDSIIKIHYGNKLIEGKFKKINRHGHLELMNNDVTQEISYGEIIL